MTYRLCVPQREYAWRHESEPRANVCKTLWPAQTLAASAGAECRSHSHGLAGGGGPWHPAAPRPTENTPPHAVREPPAHRALRARRRLPPERRSGAPTRAGPTDPAQNRQRVPSQGTACTCTSTAGFQLSLGQQGRVRGHLGTLTWAPPPSGPGRPALSGRTSDPGRPGSTRPRSSASGCTSPASTGALQASWAALRDHSFSKTN